MQGLWIPSLLFILSVHYNVGRPEGHVVSDIYVLLSQSLLAFLDPILEPGRYISNPILSAIVFKLLVYRYQHVCSQYTAVIHVLLAAFLCVFHLHLLLI